MARMPSSAAQVWEEAMDASATRRELLTGGSAALALGASGSLRQAAAQGSNSIKVMSFPGLFNYPIFSAQHKGLFAKYGIAVNLIYTPNSKVQREGLAEGEK
jgi:ABC-type nitrate/sulfonate/bicarbonate transport system substrate-binding protein